jgi:tetratricopeptide (TPR) repeat protein
MEQDKSYEQAMLAQQTASQSSGSGSGLAPGVQQQQLEKLEAQEAELSARYTDDYPDVVAVKRKIRELRAAMAKAPAPAPAPSSTAPNRSDSLSVQQLRAQLRALDQGIAQKRRDQASLTAQIRAYQGRISSTPAVQEQYKKLTRDHEAEGLIERGRLMKRILSPAAYKVTVVLGLALVLGLNLGCKRDPNKLKHHYLDSGKHYEEQGKLKEASIQFSNALKVDHNFADAHYELAKVYLKQGAAMQGYAELMRTVDLQPNNVKARIDLGNLLLAGHQTDRADDQAKAVLAIDNQNADAYALLSSIAASKGDRAEALKQIQKALSLDPNRAGFHASLGLLEASDPAKAGNSEAELRKAVSLDGKNVTAHLVLAAMLEKKGDMEGAEGQLKAAVAADPKNLVARGTLANLYLRQGNTAKAEDALRQATEQLNDTDNGADLLATYYIRTHQLDRGASVYSGLVSKYPKSAPLKLAYAQILLLKPDVPKVREIAADLTKTDSGLPQVAVLNSMLLLNDGKTDEAVTTLQKAAKANPEDLQVKLWLGRAALAKGDTNLAQKSFRDATRINPRSMDAQAGLARVSMQLHDNTTLAQVAEAAMAVAPQSSVPYLWRGMAEGNQKLWDKADADFKQAIKLDPKNSDAYFELAQLRLVQRKIPEASTLLEQALANNPNSSRALAMLVSLDISQKQPAKALSRVQAQIAKAPQNSEMYDLLSQVQLQTGDANAAMASAQKAMQLNPKDSAAVMTYARAQIATGNTAQAISTWQQWTKDHPSDAQAYTVLGTLQESQGDRNGATASYKKALSLQPDQAVASNNLAYLMTETGGNLDVALSLAQTARRQMPTSPDTADTLAWVYYQKGNYDSARDLLEDALKNAPNNASMQYHLGMIYSKLSDNTNAQLHLKKAVQLAPNTQTGKDAQAALSHMG